MSAIYRCQHCGCVSDISNSLTAFEENPHCRQCGLSVSESDTKMQDELASMMARNLNLSMVEPPQDSCVSSPPTPQVVPQTAPITYITQHYHHSAHVAPTVSVDAQLSNLLASHGIDASALVPSQIQLFRNAQTDQQQRLIELWKIAPPTNQSQQTGQGGGDWSQTSMQQEEAAAHSRWLQQEEQKARQGSVVSYHDLRDTAEPYMETGYSGLPNINGVTVPVEYRPSTDPVYQQSREWWHVADDQPIEHQYGMLQQMMQH